jgi:Holliday junction resolvasome RuvABC DNA-binding subunit
VELLEDLDSKVNTGGVVFYNPLSRFFNVQTQECATNQNWVYLKPLPLVGSQTSNRLTISVQRQLNDLVDSANQVITQAISDTQTNVKVMTLIPSN